MTLLGYRESEEDEPTLSAVPDSLIPFIQGNKNFTKIHVYKGKATMDTTMYADPNYSRAHSERNRKEELILNYCH